MGRSHTLGFIVAALAFAAPAQAQERAVPERAAVRVAATEGSRTRAEAEGLLVRASEAAGRCDDEARASGGREIRVRLEVARNGQVSTLAIVGRRDPADDAFLAWRDCAVRALTRLRLPAAAGAGTIDLLLRWERADAREAAEPSAGLAARDGTALPETAQRVQAPAVVRVPEYPNLQVRRVAREHTDEVRACFAAALADRPDLNGTVMVRFLVTPAGAVRDLAVLADDTGQPRVAACLLRRVQAWTFPSPGEVEAQATYPFVLRND